jgi:hypothetical protein
VFDPRVRGYLITVGASLAVVFVALFQRGQVTAAVIPAVLAAPGLFLRWTAMPGLVVAAVCYLLVFPTGVPFDGAAYADIRTSYFEVTDLLFVPAVLCYLAAQYRLYGLTVRAFPDDRPKYLQRASDHQPRRSAGTIGGMELQWLFAGVGGAVFAGQLLWLGLTRIELDLADFPAVGRPERGAASKASRFVLFVGLLGGTGLAARLVFWYWRLARLNADEARLAVLGAGWEEVRREAARQETWRAWGFPGRRGGDRLSFWAGLRTPFTILLVLVAIGFVARMLWVFFQLP